MTVIKGEGRKISRIDNQVIKIAFPFFLGLFIFILALSISKKEIQSTQPRFEIRQLQLKINHLKLIFSQPFEMRLIL